MTRLAALLLLLASSALADVYDEPWHEQVAKVATTLARVEVLEVGRHEVKLKTVKLLAGAELPAELTVVVSRPDHPHPVPFEARASYYLFLVQDAQGAWSLPTPTSGFALERPDGLIQGTYRHSYHQCLAPPELYEETQAAIFRAHHGQAAAPELIARLVDALLTKKPDALPEDPTDPANFFFRQHVALETVFHLGWGTIAPERALVLLEPFLTSEPWHVQVSAVRALERVPGGKAKRRLVAFLRQKDRAPFAQVMAVWALKRLKARGLREELEGLVPAASTAQVGFGGNLMDPRVGTVFPPSVQAALQELVDEWRAAEEPR